MAGLWESLGEGFRGMGAVASPRVAQQQADERANELPRMLQGLQIANAKRAYDADGLFSDAMSKVDPATLKTSSDVLTALKGVPMDVIATSPKAQAALKMAGAMQQKEALAEQRKQTLELQEQRIALEKARLDVVAGKAPPTRNRIAGDQEIQEEYDPQNHSWREIGRGPRFAKQVTNASGPGTFAPQAKFDEAYKKLDQPGQTALDTQAWNWINTKQLPYRRGSGGGADRNDFVMYRAGQIANSLGMTAEELSAKSSDFKSNAQSLAFATKKLDAIEGVLSSFHNNVDTWDSIAKGIAPKLGGDQAKAMGPLLAKINFTGIKSLDEVKLRIQQQVNDPTVAAYLTATMSVAMDYARIMQGPQSAAALTEGARKDAERLISAGLNDNARKSVIGALASDTEGQVKGLRDQTNKIRKRMGMAVTGGSDEPKQEAKPKAENDPLGIRG